MPAQTPEFSFLSRSSRWSGVALLALVVASACDKMPLTAPSGTAITLLASPNPLPLNGAADITAVLIEGGLNGDGAVASGSGTPVHNGTVVSFSTTLGRIEPGEAQTKAGKVVVRLVADGRAGTATITAFSGAARQTLDVTIGDTAAPSASLNAAPARLPATGDTVRPPTATEITAPAEATVGVPSPLSVTVAHSPASITTSVSATFTATVPANASIASYEWNFGNGATAETSGPQVAYRFPNAGTFTVSVRAVPTVGPAATMLLTVVVN